MKSHYKPEWEDGRQVEEEESAAEKERTVQIQMYSMYYRSMAKRQILLGFDVYELWKTDTDSEVFTVKHILPGLKMDT